MNQVILNNVSYEKLIPITLYKYEFVLLIKDGCIYYALEKDSYDLVDANDNTNRIHAGYIKCCILMEYIIKLLNDNLTSDRELIYDMIFKIQDVLQYSEIYNLIKNNSSDEELISKFREYYNLKFTKNTKKKNKIDNKKETQGNTDIFMIIMITNIGILLFIMFVLNLIK